MCFAVTACSDGALCCHAGCFAEVTRLQREAGITYFAEPSVEHGEQRRFYQLQAVLAFCVCCVLLCFLPFYVAFMLSLYDIIFDVQFACFGWRTHPFFFSLPATGDAPAALTDMWGCDRIFYAHRPVSLSAEVSASPLSLVWRKQRQMALNETLFFVCGCVPVRLAGCLRFALPSV